MPIDYKHIKKQFEKSLNEYEKNAIVQDIMASKMILELTKIQKTYGNILELGSGTGLTTKKIANNINFNKYYANDIVDKSQIYIQKIIPNAYFIHGNALKIKTQQKMDLVVSNAMFQWFENLDKAICILKNLINTDGIIAFSTFSPNNFKEIKELTGLSLQYISLEEIKNVLTKYKFEIIHTECFSKKLEFNTPIEILVHMKKTGVNSLSKKSWTIKNIKEFCDKYSEKYPSSQLTYSPIIVIARYKNFK